MSYAQRIEEKLTNALSPTKLTVKDESHLHSGHSGAHEDGESHFRVTIVSEQFEGKSRVARQREVYKILESELKEHVHALALSTVTPNEAADQK
jgi:BolA protein